MESKQIFPETFRPTRNKKQLKKGIQQYNTGNESLGKCSFKNLPKKTSITSNDKDLDFYVALLITFNHNDVWNYGFSFFLKALEVVQHIQKQVAYTMSTGIGLAFSSKEKQDLFLKEM